MGAQPLYYTLALTMPSADESWLQAFSDALHGIAKQYDCALIGGDTTQGPLTISLQVHGSVLPASVLRRDGAKIGDKVYVTDCLGDGAASLAMLQGKQVFTDPHKEYLKQRFYCPEPQINAGIALRGLAHAAVDISDGLLADCQHMASASDVDFILDVEQIPLSAACQSVDLALARQWAFSGGDDYQLAFTIPEQNHKALAQLLTSGKIKATCIGSVKARGGEKPAVICHYQQQPWSPPWLTQGFDHFAT